VIDCDDPTYTTHPMVAAGSELRRTTRHEHPPAAQTHFDEARRIERNSSGIVRHGKFNHTPRALRRGFQQFTSLQA
jgi:hypothetical protein